MWGGACQPGKIKRPGLVQPLGYKVKPACLICDDGRAMDIMRWDQSRPDQAAGFTFLALRSLRIVDISTNVAKPTACRNICRKIVGDTRARTAMGKP